MIGRSNERMQRDWDSGGDYLDAGLASGKSTEKRKRFSHLCRDSEFQNEGYAPSRPATPRLIKFETDFWLNIKNICIIDMRIFHLIYDHLSRFLYVIVIYYFCLISFSLRFSLFFAKRNGRKMYYSTILYIVFSTYVWRRYPSPSFDPVYILFFKDVFTSC